MTEQLISFKTAKLAKKGGVTFSQHNQVYNDEGYICIVGYDDDISILEAEDIPCITQSLLQKWLREKHNIHVQPVLEYVFNPTREMYTSYNTWNIICMDINYDFKDFPINRIKNTSYEEALEAGLQEALKLIKT